MKLTPWRIGKAVFLILGYMVVCTLEIAFGGWNAWHRAGSRRRCPDCNRKRNR